MIKIYISEQLLEEKKYIVDVIFNDFLSLKYKIIKSTDDFFRVELTNGKSIFTDGEWWKKNKDGYLNKLALPSASGVIENTFTDNKKLPLLFGSKSFEITENTIKCGVDIFATCFFELTRFEEVLSKTKDEHGRFPSTSSVAYQRGYLEIPIVDEYVNMLFNMITYFDPSVKRSNKLPSKFITCDVDYPFDPIRKSLKKTLRSFLGDVIKRKDFKSGIMRLINYSAKKINIKTFDEYNDAIYWIMAENEKLNNKVAFYFITECTSDYDSDFDFESKEMRSLLNDISVRGHEIGLHPGFNCCNNEELFTKSANKLKSVLMSEKIVQPYIGGRMHYLKWDPLNTPRFWNDNGFTYDSSLSYADRSGFRCGTSLPFKMFDLKERRSLNLWQKPLINMETTILSQSYEGLENTPEKALERFLFFKETTLEYGGLYTLLWHNTYLSNKELKNIYIKVIE